MALLASLTASLSLVVPDATINMVKISSIKGGSGQLPLAMCRWPLWIASADHVTKLSGAGGDEEEAGWVDPISFEQLWLPEDLPLPSSHLAVSLVIKDGVPRYLLPCIETSITTVSGVSGTVWHNRGLNSVPLGAQWMAWGEAPLKAYRLFSFGSDFKPPAPPPARRHPRGARAAAEEGAAEEADTAEEELPPAWEPLQVMADRPGGGGQPVEEALGSIMRVLAEAGAEIKEMGEGYHFITARVDGGALPADTVRPGRKLRLILATALDDPNPNDEEWEGEMLSFARCDTTVYSIPAGGESEFMPECYKPLYGAGSMVSDERIL
uniref:Uncharacterized protein n=1 Tax=Phaeocystis antarctica TaxID=33657 RepID=A0A7S0ERZ3_9EUKA